METDVFKIESGIPTPRETRGKTRRYPARDLKVGDSFAVPPSLSASARNACVAVRKEVPGWDYTSRAMTENGQRVIRFWRIS